MTARASLLLQLTVPPGPVEVRVGSTVYTAPRGAGVAQSADPRLVYVLLHSRVHALTEAGEVAIPDPLRHEIASRYFGAGRGKS